MVVDILEDFVLENYIIKAYDKVINWTVIYPLVENLYSKEGKH